jgi:hypothetical protein
MGKYLQDLMYRVDDDFLQKEAYDQCRLIADLFNAHLPDKIDVGGNIWRFIVWLTADKTLDGTTREVGLCQDCYVFIDSGNLLDVYASERKNVLLKLFVKGLQLCSNACNYSPEVFLKIEEKLIAEGVVFDRLYKERKTSPDKSHSAQMRGRLSESNKEFSVVIFDKHDCVVKEIRIGDLDFRQFDRLKWISNSVLNIYQINFIQSYKRKKVAEDHFSVDIESGTIVYVPVTRESVFDYGVKLLTETDQFESALNFIKQSKVLGHGKADNILQNLEINPLQRDRAILLQTPKRSR